MMTRLQRLTVVLASVDPLSLGSGRSVGNRVETHRYIPGTVLRGALAAAWLFDKSTADRDSRSEFVELFEGSTVFGPAFEESATIEPLSVLRCKHRPEPGCWGFLLDLAAATASEFSDCGVCGGPTALGKGEVLGVTVLDRTRTALEGGTAKEGHLFTRSVLPAGTVFRGEFIVRDERAAAWLTELAGSTVWVGGGRSTGGRVVIKRVSEDPVTQPEDLAAGGPAVMRLHSPAILVDSSTRPLVVFTEQILAEALGVSCEVERQWVRTEVVGGWNAVAGSPKPQEVALVAGSTVRFVPREPVEADRLIELVARGVGLRRNEGFGRVAINPPTWAPPELDSRGAADSADALEAFWGLESVGLSTMPEVARAIAQASALGTPTERTGMLGRDYDRNLDNLQRRELERVMEHDASVLKDLAVCLEVHQSDRQASRGRHS